MSDLSSGRSARNQLADLHIFVVPLELWLDKYRTAFNNIALESVSAGFVRIHPEANLHQLRESIEEQLGEDVIPEEFIFLRSVGRCMAVVKENQEHLLRAGDFLPPIAYSPEIFLLPGLHEHYAKPGTDSKNVVIATQGHTTAGMSTTHPFQLPMIPHQYGLNQNLTTQPNYPSHKPYHSNQEEDKKYEDDQQIMPKKYKTRCDDYDENDADDDDDNISDHQNKLKHQRDSFDEEQLHSQFENQGRKSNDRHSGGYHGDSEHRSSGENQDIGLSPQSQKKDHSSVKSKNKKNKHQRAGITTHDDNSQPTEATTLQIIQPEVVHSLPVQGPDGVLMAPPTPIPSGRVIASPIPGPRKEKSIAKQDENTSKESSGKESKISRGSKKKRKERSKSPPSERDLDKNIRNKEDKRKQEEPPNAFVVASLEDVEERSRYTQFPSPTRSARSQHPLYESEIDSGIADDLVTPPQALNDSHGTKKGSKELHDQLANGSKNTVLNEIEELAGHQGLHQVTFSEEDAHGKDSKTTGDDSKGGQNIAKHSDKDDAGKDSKTSHKKPKKTVKKTVKKMDDLDEKLKNLKAVEPPLLKIPDHTNISFEKDTPSAKDRKHKIIEELRGELRKAKNERVDLEKQRDQKVRRAKTLQTQTLQKRNQAKNIWKKKFFDEKRKTAPLEEQLNRLRYDVEVQHKAIVSYLETNRERDGNRGTLEQEKTPSQKTNQLMLLAKLQNEVEELKHKVEETKMRLASEMKLRDNAQGELKQLREELLDKKINLTLTKSQKSLLLLSTQENITAQ